MISLCLSLAFSWFADRYCNQVENSESILFFNRIEEIYILAELDASVNVSHVTNITVPILMFLYRSGSQQITVYSGEYKVPISSWPETKNLLCTSLPATNRERFPAFSLWTIHNTLIYFQLIPMTTCCC